MGEFLSATRKRSSLRRTVSSARFTLGDVFGKDHQPSDGARAVVPRQNFPTNPLSGPVGALEVIVFFAQDFSAQAATMSFSPAFGNCWKNLIVRKTAQLAVAESVVRAPTRTGMQVAQVAIEHRQLHWRMLYKQSESLFSFSQGLFSSPLVSDVFDQCHVPAQ